MFVGIPLILIVIIGCLFFLNLQDINTNETSYTTEILAENLEVPWPMTFYRMIE